MFDWIFSPVTNIVGKSVKNAFKWMIKFLIATILGMVRRLVEAIADFFSASSGVSFTSGWWTSEGAQALMKVMGRIGLLLVLLFLIAAIIDGMVHANVGTMIRTVLVQVPTTLAMTGGLVVLATTLLTLSDQMSSALLGSQFAQDRYLELFSMENVSKGGLLAVVFSALFSIAVLFVWVVLFVRAQIIYVLMLFAPIMLAMNIWPSTKKSFRRWVEVSVAMIFAKPVIAGAMALAVAAFTNIDPVDPSGVAASSGASLAAMLAAVVFMAVACFSPFMLLKLIPIVAASGVGQEAMSKLGSGAKSVGKGVFDSMGGGGSTGSGGGGSPSSSSGAGSSSGGSGAASGPFGAAGGAGATSGAVGSGSGAAAAAGGPPGVAVAAGAAAVSTAQRAADQARSAAERSSGSSSSSGDDSVDGADQSGAYALPTATATSGSPPAGPAGDASSSAPSRPTSVDASPPSPARPGSSDASDTAAASSGASDVSPEPDSRSGAPTSVPSSSSRSGSTSGGWSRPQVPVASTPVRTPTFDAPDGPALTQRSSPSNALPTGPGPDPGSTSTGSTSTGSTSTGSTSTASTSTAPTGTASRNTASTSTPSTRTSSSAASTVPASGTGGRTAGAPEPTSPDVTGPSTAATRRARNSNSNLRNPDRTES